MGFSDESEKNNGGSGMSKRMKWINRETGWDNRCVYCGEALLKGTKVWMRKDDGPGGKWELCCDDCYRNASGDPGDDLTEVDGTPAPPATPMATVPDGLAGLAETGGSDMNHGGDVPRESNERPTMEEFIDKCENPPKSKHKPYSLPWIKENAKWMVV
jgi:hypothetical protein